MITSTIDSWMRGINLSMILFCLRKIQEKRKNKEIETMMKRVCHQILLKAPI
jgi:hypothetical protein